MKASGDPLVVDPVQEECCPTNEQLYEDKLCYERTCEQELSGIKINCKYEKADYTHCDCSPGYYRNTQNDCVPIDQCEGYTGTGETTVVDETTDGETENEIACCPPNEELKYVINGCAENTCERKRQNFQAICDPIYPYPTADHPYCDCKTDLYFRNNENNCVAFGECDDVSDTPF